MQFKEEKALQSQWFLLFMTLQELEPSYESIPPYIPAGHYAMASVKLAKVEEEKREDNLSHLWQCTTKDKNQFTSSTVS